jgi:transcriptional regulator with XRE-family HTH domain
MVISESGEPNEQALRSAGALIGKYRSQKRHLSQGQLAEKIGIDRSYLSLIEHGERRPSAEVATRIAEILAFSYEDRDAFYTHLNMWELIHAHHDVVVERRAYGALQGALNRASVAKRFFQSAKYVLDWGLGRLYVARFDMKRAVPQLEPISKRLVDDFEEDTLLGITQDHEFRGIVWLDMADAYAIAGNLDPADRWALRSEQHGHRLLQRETSPKAQRRLLMGVARAIVMQLEVAYERGDEAGCWALYQRAKPFLRAAQDYYGWSKSLFFLSLFRFWQGQLDEAKTQIDEARAAVNNITQQRPDFWWLVRDGTYYLGSHWWDIITSSQLLDVLLCSGQSGEENFDIEFLRHQQAHGVASWTRDFPPFSPRYLWLDAVGTRDLTPFDQRFKRWLAQTKALGCKHLHTDLLISYGDFLRWGNRDPKAASEHYQEAKRLAETYGYWLFAQAAERRLRSQIAPFPALDRLRI